MAKQQLVTSLLDAKVAADDWGEHMPAVRGYVRAVYLNRYSDDSGGVYVLIECASSGVMHERAAAHVRALPKGELL